MHTEATNRLSYLLDTAPELLKQIPESEIAYKPSPANWSKKEILGHLIDSAANNLQRIVRIQYESNPLIMYRQDEWNRYSYHQNAAKTDLVLTWELFNRHLLFIVQQIPEKSAGRTCRVSETETMTLNQLVDDYVVHMEHHLRQIIEY